MRKRRSSHKAITEQDISWVVPYADFITLLFAFFVVMYAISTISLSKYEDLASSLSTAFTSFEITPNKFDGGTLTVPLYYKPALTTSRFVFWPKGNQLLKQNKSMLQSVQHTYTTKGSFIHTLPLLPGFKARGNQDWVEIELTNALLFDSGMTKLTSSAKALLRPIAHHIKANHFKVTIEGYTDNTPIFTTHYPSNWELSSARASSVARYFFDIGIVSHKMSVVGYGDSHPVAYNDTDEGRAQNRRIVLVISKGHSVQRLLSPKLSLLKNDFKSKSSRDKYEKGTPIVDVIKLENGGLKFKRGIKKSEKQNNF